MFVILFLILVSIPSISNATNTYNPIDYGLNNAADGIERYFILSRCHNDAAKCGASISYKGIDTLRIDIPAGAEPIPLTSNVDFSGVTLIVKNLQKDYPLFVMSSPVKQISEIESVMIDKGDFRSNEYLAKGRILLIIKDRNVWTPRTGYSTKSYRRDIILLRNGKALNKTVTRYPKDTSNPIVWFRIIGNKKIIIKNLNFIRAQESTRKTYCFLISNQYNITLRNIKITTPDDSDKYADQAISICDCADVTLDEIHIEGTYSQSRQYGYGVSINNVYNLKVNKMYARSKWGVFGTNNINKSLLKNCDVNRFDIHCYGRDVEMVNCKFSSYYNQFSSIYGKIKFRKCEFIHFVPLLWESTFNAYTPFDVEWKNCIFHLDKNNNYIITLRGIPNQPNERQELKIKSLPNITMKDCKVYIDDNLSEWVLIKTGGGAENVSFDYISKIILKDIDVYSRNLTIFRTFSEPIKTIHNINTLFDIENKKND